MHSLSRSLNQLEIIRQSTSSLCNLKCYFVTAARRPFCLLSLFPHLFSSYVRIVLPQNLRQTIENHIINIYATMNVQLPSCQTVFYYSLFFLKASRLWNSVPTSVKSLRPNLFRSKVTALICGGGGSRPGFWVGSQTGGRQKILIV